MADTTLTDLTSATSDSTRNEIAFGCALSDLQTWSRSSVPLQGQSAEGTVHPDQSSSSQEAGDSGKDLWRGDVGYTIAYPLLGG